MVVNRTSIIPPLEGGDRLSRHEFERRYLASFQVKKAELIEGVVYLPSPVRSKSHAVPHGRLITWLGVYEAATPGVELNDNATVRLDLDNEPQPDALLRIETGGNSRITKDDYIEGAPEFIAEIAASSAAYDLHDKKRAYRRNGVQEYLVWQVFDRKIDWFCLQQDEYVLMQSDMNGILKSQAFPGLWLMLDALLTGNMERVLATVQEGISSPEHRSFLEKSDGNS
jgi:Uma2 family endonuclease